MAKKQSDTIKFPKEDADTMWALWKRVITINDVQLIYNLYKKYVDSSAPYPIVGCGACELSASKYYENLRDWHLNNNHLFE